MISIVGACKTTGRDSEFADLAALSRPSQWQRSIWLLELWAEKTIDITESFFTMVKFRISGS
jgi:hypothetical protein